MRPERAYSHRMKRFFVVSALALVLLGIAVFAWALLRPQVSPGAIAVRGGEPLNIQVTKTLPHFCQKDATWSAERIGGSGESIGAVGCTLCCVGMAFDHFDIAENDPGSLNATLIENGGYTERGWIRWNSVGKASGNRVRVQVHNGPSHEQIDADLLSGRLVLAKFYLPLGIPHWVLICGKKGDDYLIKDPALSTPGLIRFSTRADSIVSTRTLSLRE